MRLTEADLIEKARVVTAVPAQAGLADIILATGDRLVTFADLALQLIDRFTALKNNPELRAMFEQRISKASAMMNQISPQAIAQDREKIAEQNFEAIMATIAKFKPMFGNLTINEAYDQLMANKDLVKRYLSNNALEVQADENRPNQ